MVVWEYTQLIVETRRLSEAPDESMLSRLRTLEVKMGLVLTLVSTFAFVRVHDVEINVSLVQSLCMGCHQRATSGGVGVVHGHNHDGG